MATLDAAKDFVENNFPIVYIYPAKDAPRPIKVRICYSHYRRDREQTAQEGDWICDYVSLSVF